PDQFPLRPDICLGTDPFHTPVRLVSAAWAAFAAAGFSVAINRPFRGALVPSSHFGCDQRVSALMVEVNRSLYMDEGSGQRTDAYPSVRARLQAALSVVIDGYEPEGAPDATLTGVMTSTVRWLVRMFVWTTAWLLFWMF